MDQNNQKSSYFKDLGLFILDILINAVVIIALVLLIRKYLMAPFQVYGPSMCDTLNFYEDSCKQAAGEYLIINKFIYEVFSGNPQRGDIIVFKEPVKEEEFYIKRVIGVPGDTVILEDGFVYIKNEKFPNGIKLDEISYLNDINFGKTKAFKKTLTQFIVPENSYFVLGDNRTASADSRRFFMDNGSTDTSKAFIKKDLIMGKALVVIWPPKNIRILRNPNYGAL